MKQIANWQKSCLISNYLNVNRLNSPIKGRDWQTRFFKRSNYMLSTKDSLQIQRHSFKVKRWKKTFYAINNSKKLGIVIILDKIDFKPENITKDKDIIH